MKRRSEAIHVVVPGPLDQATGGYRYDAAIVTGLRAQGLDVVVHELAGRFPQVDATATAAARQALKAIGKERAVIDGLALPAFDGLLAKVKRIAALVHHPLWLETGLAREAAEALRRREGAMLKPLARIIVTSEATRRDVIDLGVKSNAISVVEPGTAGGPARTRRPGTTRLLCVGTLTRRKAHDVLLRALARQRRARWRLLCVGSTSRDPAQARRLRSLAVGLRLAARVRFVGEVPDVTRFYARSDLFILPSRHEGYGMAFAEALACGVPAVGARAGAVPGVVPKQAGVLVPPGQIPALSRALRPLLISSRRRERLAHGAYMHRRRFPGWAAQAFRFAAALP